MNTKWFFIVFLPLAVLIAAYPPYQWDADYSNSDYALGMQLPIKEHDFLFNADTKYFTLQHYRVLKNEERILITDTVQLTRHIAPRDIVLDVFLAAIISLLAADVVRRKTKP